jgi:outer membrane lipoprotein-sorting protein
MKKIKLLFVALIFTVTAQIQAQTADEIISTYFENIGGTENFEKLQGLKFNASINQQGMVIPIEMIQLKNGKQMTVITFQGKEIKQGVFNGETLWSTNFMTQTAEKSDQETTDNFKLEANDFPDSFLNYKEKGYGVELIGKETVDGTETFKIKLTKEPVTVDGIKEDNISFYYFDTENFVPIIVENEIKSGPAKGQISQIKFSDYQEVDGLYFPFSFSQGLKDQGGQMITIEKIELNPTVDDSAFEFPKDAPETKDKE